VFAHTIYYCNNNQQDQHIIIVGRKARQVGGSFRVVVIMQQFGLEKAARQGHCKASILAAGWYLKGSKVGKDVMKARMLLNRAAYQGSSDAQVTLAREIENQFEPLRVVTKAVKWYRVAATHGNVQAWKSLGHYYLFDSNAATTDYIEGASAFCQGAILGCPECLRNLAECYMKGIGVPKINLDVDYEQVLQWLATEVKRHRNS
jgi:TPR repeat protein